MFSVKDVWCTLKRNHTNPSIAMTLISVMTVCTLLITFWTCLLALRSSIHHLTRRLVSDSVMAGYGALQVDAPWLAVARSRAVKPYFKACLYLPEPSGHDDSGGGGAEKEIAEQHRVVSEGAGWFVWRASTPSIWGNNLRPLCSQCIIVPLLWQFVLCYLPPMVICLFIRRMMA